MVLLSFALVAVAVVVVVAASYLVSMWIRKWSDAYRIGSLAEVPTGSLIVVLGCPPETSPGRRNAYFVGRVASAAAAYHHSPERRLLCSGRIHEAGVDEADALATALEAASVPRTAIELDRRAARTIDTIDFLVDHRTRAPILLVTQDFHLPRAILLARIRGLDARGLLARGPVPGIRVRTREQFARWRALIDLIIRL